MDIPNGDTNRTNDNQRDGEPNWKQQGSQKAVSSDAPTFGSEMTGRRHHCILP
jgi:hypothetical protein